MLHVNPMLYNKEKPKGLAARSCSFSEFSLKVVYRNLFSRFFHCVY